MVGRGSDISSPLPVANLAFLLQKVQSYEGRPMLADEFQKLFDEVDKGVVKEVSRSGLGHLSSPRATKAIGVSKDHCQDLLALNPQSLGLAMGILWLENLLDEDIYYSEKWPG